MRQDVIESTNAVSGSLCVHPSHLPILRWKFPRLLCPPQFSLACSPKKTWSSNSCQIQAFPPNRTANIWQVSHHFQIFFFYMVTVHKKWLTVLCTDSQKLSTHFLNVAFHVVAPSCDVFGIFLFYLDICIWSDQLREQFLLFHHNFCCWPVLLVEYIQDTPHQRMTLRRTNRLSLVLFCPHLRHMLSWSCHPHVVNIHWHKNDRIFRRKYGSHKRRFPIVLRTQYMFLKSSQTRMEKIAL